MTSETELLLRGSASFVDDVRDSRLDGAAHAVFVRATVAHANFTVDLGEAEQAPGVVCVLAAEHNPVWPLHAHSPANAIRFAQPLLAEHKVRYVGEPIAVVVADSLAQAVDAAELVIVDYEPLTPVLSAADAVRGDTLLFDTESVPRYHRNSAALGDDFSNVIRTHLDGDVATDTPIDFDAFDIVVRQQFRNPRQAAAPIECRAVTAVWQGDHVHCWVSTQIPHGLKTRIVAIYDLDPANVHVVAGPHVGGGFGGKGAPGPEEQLLPHIARVAGRAVRWVESRTENLTAATQGRAEDIELWLAGSADGDMQAVKAVLHKDAGAYASSGAGLPNLWSAPMLTGTYDIAQTEFEQVTYVSNRPPVSALRGAGRGPILHALECAVDQFASVAGLDPAEVRRRNLIEPAAMPFTAPTGAVFDDADYAGALELLVDAAGYEELRAEQQKRRDEPGNERRQLGIGLASYNHRTCGGGGESALVRITPDGGATVVTGTTSQGQKHEKAWRTIASQELAIPPERITVIEGVTDEISTGVGAIGSRSVQTAGLAIHEAAAQVVSDAAALAAAMLEAAPADIMLDRERGAFHVVGTPSRSLGWAELAQELAARDEQLSCDHVYNNNGKDVFPSGCHLAVVEVDTDTGAWKLVRYVAVDDAGVRVDSDSVDGQLHGGIALGVAQVLGEAMTFDELGTPLAGNFLDYPVLTIDQICQLELHPQVVPSSFNVNGYKAVGESGPIGATPAVHNAVIDALRPLGVDYLDLPCSPQAVWSAVRLATQDS